MSAPTSSGSETGDSEPVETACPGDGLEDALAANRKASLTDAKDRLEKCVAEREATIRSIYNAVFQPVLTIDDESRIECANVGAQELFSYGEEEMRGRELTELLPAFDSGRDAMDRVRSPELKSGVETEGVRSDGSRFPAHVAANEGEAQGHRVVAVMVRDLTEFDQARRRALQAERLAAIGETIAGLAHESRNVLQRLQASISLLELKARGNEELTALAQDMQEAQDQLHALYEEVRDYAAPISLERERRDLKALIKETWNKLALSHEPKRLTLTVIEEADDASVSVDARRMEQVFRNVLQNAIEAAPEESHIQAELKNPGSSEGDHLHIILRDGGTGFDESQKDRMFEPFYTTKKYGTGLGLPIARRIMEAHGGRITAAATGEGGAEIRLTLPRKVSTD